MSYLNAAPEAGEHPLPTARPRPPLTWSSWAGIVGPPLFTLGFLAQEFVRRGEYDPIAEPISALEAGPLGWIQQVNFVVFGVLIIVFALGLHRGIRPAGRIGLVGAAILTWSGVGLILSAVFPLRDDVAGDFYDPTGMHTINGTIFFLSLGTGLILISRRLARDPAWRGLAGYALGSGIILMVSFPFFGLVVRPDDAPLHDFAGLVQRASVAVWFAAIVTLAVRLRRLTAVATAPISSPAAASTR